MSNPSLRVRPATPEDIPTIRDLASRIWHACYTRIIGATQIEFMLGWMYHPETLRDQMARGVYWELVEIDSAAQGFISTTWEQSQQQLELNKLYLSPALHGCGLGQKLLSHVKDRARTLGARSVQLRVNKANTQALAAYRRAGFVVLESVVQDIGQGFVMDDYVMIWSHA
jgi:ribosomal protein S18 acetylase RimI-like enzyme